MQPRADNKNMLQFATETFVVAFVCICKKVSEKPPCVRQQTLFINNRPHAAGLPDADEKLRT